MKTLTTVAQAAAEMQISAARVGKLCRDNGIGTMISDRLRVLYPEDMRRLREIRKPSGRPKSLKIG